MPTPSGVHVRIVQEDTDALLWEGIMNFLLVEGAVVSWSQDGGESYSNYLVEETRVYFDEVTGGPGRTVEHAQHRVVVGVSPVP